VIIQVFVCATYFMFGFFFQNNWNEPFRFSIVRYHEALENGTSHHRTEERALLPSGLVTKVTTRSTGNNGEFGCSEAQVCVVQAIILI